ncbi:MAG: ATP-binding protein [Opitutaceae bacterium]|jgi:light-regulated signal transduction histidine kinase (bacteriophytochrome)
MMREIEKEPNGTKAEVNELRRLNLQLERRVEYYAAFMGREHAEIDALSQSISHDLRSPLTIIGGFADLLAKHTGPNLDETGRHYLQRITTATSQVGQMLDEILALSKVSRSEMRSEPVDLESAVRRVVRDLDASKGDRRVVWMIAHLPTVVADPGLLLQAISSLLANALNFTRSREVARIQVGAQDGDEESIFFVRDNGASFDIAHRERMFDGSLRMPPSSDTKGGATRLAHVRRIIQRHGGRMWTEAVPDGGATFFFSLPRVDAEPQTREPQP